MRRMFLTFLAAVCLIAGSPAPGSAADPVDFATFLKNPENYDGKEILLSGFLSLEDYSKALFLTQEDYAEGRFENSVPVIIPFNILNMREAFQRTFVKLRGVYNHGCAQPDMFCSAHPGQGFLGPVLEIWGERLPENERPVYREPVLKTVWDEMTVSETEDPDHEPIIQLAHKFSRAVIADDREALLALFETDDRKRVEADLPGGRSGWLLFKGEYNYRDAFRSAKMLAIIPLRMKKDPLQPQVAAACYCVTEDCLGKLRDPMPSEAVTAGSFIEPYKCMPFHKSAQGWVIDAGFLLSFDGQETPFGNDLGLMSRLGGGNAGEETVAFAFTHPPYTFSEFLTRLRERPRPRVADAMRRGRLKIPVVYITPTRTAWSMALENGRIKTERLELDRPGN